MRFKKFAATSALVIAALGVTAGTSYADVAPAQDASAIHYDAKIEGASVVLKTDIGSLTTEGDQFQVRDTQGGLVTAFPLSFVKDGLAFPIAAQIDGNTATLTPNMDPAAAHPADLALHNVASQADQDSAWSAASSQFAVITAIGTVMGTLVGGVGGCVIGALIGTPLLLPGWVGGCLGGAAVGIPIGAAAGLVLTGVPAAIGVGIGFFSRISAP